MHKSLKPVSKLATTGMAALALAFAAGTASAAETKLRIQTHFSPETLSGQMAAEFIEDGKLLADELDGNDFTKFVAAVLTSFINDTHSAFSDLSH